VAPRTGNPAWPFCSERCRLADLGRWLGEAYRIPGDRAGDGSAGAPRPGDEEEIA
jgi:endogenous inhibitor of DNA gyrase (YacG/DUF329 family)